MVLSTVPLTAGWLRTGWVLCRHWWNKYRVAVNCGKCTHYRLGSRKWFRLITFLGKQLFQQKPIDESVTRSKWSEPTQLWMSVTRDKSNAIIEIRQEPPKSRSASASQGVQQQQKREILNCLNSGTHPSSLRLRPIGRNYHRPVSKP